MYHAESTKYEANKYRRQVFVQCDRQIKNLPHMQDSLKQHILRAVFKQCLFGPDR